ncbi:MAG TPA: flagellar hook-length control protein FliK [Anaerovoracaceae bacterium]|nr:flagellar hook-length control protein FliK [Anaerovoracaceae bacterium]
MNIDNSIGKALLFSGDAGGAAVAAGWQGIADTGQQGTAKAMTAGYAGSLFQQLIVQMLTAKGSAAETADEAGGGAQDMLGETDSDLLAAMLLTEGNFSGISLMDAGTGAGEAGGGKVKAGGSNPEAKSGTLDILAALTGGQAEGIQALLNTMAGAVQVTEGSRTAVRSQGSPAEVMAVSLGATVAGGDDAGIPASLKALFLNGTQAAVLTETGSLPEGTNAQITAQRQPAQQAAIVGSKFPAFAAYGMNGKAPTTDGTGQAALSGGNSAVPAPTEIDSAQPNPSQAVLNARSGTVVSGQEAGMQEGSIVPQTTDTETGFPETAPVKGDKAPEESETADYSQIAQETQHLHSAGQSGGAAEQDPFIPTVDKAEPYSQIRDEILAKLEQKGTTEFKMQLEPEDLGQIDIKLKLSEGKLIIDILAANSKTQALLTSQVDKLIAGMGLQNVQVESVHVSQQMNSQNQDSSQSQSNLMNTAMDFSHRKQQEQFQGESAKGADLTGTYGLPQQETQDSGPTGRIEAYWYGSHRMNYTV